MAGKNLSSYHKVMDPRVSEKRKAIQQQFKENGEPWMCDCGKINTNTSCDYCTQDYEDIPRDFFNEQRK